MQKVITKRRVSEEALYSQNTIPERRGGKNSHENDETMENNDYEKRTIEFWAE